MSDIKIRQGDLAELDHENMVEFELTGRDTVTGVGARMSANEFVQGVFVNGGIAELATRINVVEHKVDDIEADAVLYTYEDAEKTKPLVVYKPGTKVLATFPDGTQHELLGVASYPLVIDGTPVLDGDGNQVYVLYCEVGTSGAHLNLNTNDDPQYDIHVTVDTPEGKKVLAYMDDLPDITDLTERVSALEGAVTSLQVSMSELESEIAEKAGYENAVLNLDAKYFTPVGNSLQGITVDEVQREYEIYQKGIKTITTNTPGFFGVYVVRFNVNADTITFEYRFGIANYDTGIVTVYRALISAVIGAGITTPVQVEYTFEAPGVGEVDAIAQKTEDILSYFPEQLQSPADESQVVRTSTDVQVNAHKLTWNGAGYTQSDENIVIPSANPTQAGAYPADHYNKVQNLPTETQPLLTGSDSIALSPEVALRVASSDEVISVDANGVKINIRLDADGSDIVLYGSETNELGRVSIARGIVESGSYDTATNEIVLSLADGSEIRIPADDLVDEYTAGAYLELAGTEFSVDYNLIHDKLIADGFIGDFGRKQYYTMAEVDTEINDAIEALPEPLKLGNTSTTACPGNIGYAGYHHSTELGNPHQTKISDISGLQAELDSKVSAVDATAYVAGSHVVFDDCTIHVDYESIRDRLIADGLTCSCDMSGYYTKEEVEQKIKEAIEAYHTEPLSLYNVPVGTDLLKYKVIFTNTHLLPKFKEPEGSYQLLACLYDGETVLTDYVVATYQRSGGRISSIAPTFPWNDRNGERTLYNGTNWVATFVTEGSELMMYNGTEPGDNYKLIVTENSLSEMLEESEDSWSLKYALLEPIE